MLKHHDLAMTYELENSGDSSFQNLCVLRTHGIRPGTTWDPQNQKGHVIAQNCFKLEQYTSNFRTFIPPLSTYQHIPNHYNNISNHINIWVWVKIRYPNNWMVNTKLDIHICGPLNGLPFWPTSIYQHFYPTISIHFPPFISLGRQLRLGLEKHEPLQQVDEGLPNPRSLGSHGIHRPAIIRPHCWNSRLNHTQMLHVWYIYLQNWVIYVGQMLGFIFQHHGAYGILNHGFVWKWKIWTGGWDWDSPVMAPS